MISHSKKFVFVHIPKTAGTSITNVLDSYCEIKPNHNVNSPFYYHASVIELKNFFNKMEWDWDDYFKFTFVRNPWDRLVSYYEFSKQRYERLKKLELLSNDLICKNFGENVKSFEDFILNLETYAPNSDSYYYSINGTKELNYVGKVDTIQHDFDYVCKIIGIPTTTLPRLQSSNRKHYTKYYNEFSKKIVSDRFSDDIEMFGHIFSKQIPQKNYKKGFLKYSYYHSKNEQKQMRFNAYNGRKPNSQ